eukprot:m.7373 g.7373  ORF g.7373 m.7373 type:complete len:50 (+) comp5240_c0_seq1:283-432(+)
MRLKYTLALTLLLGLVCVSASDEMADDKQVMDAPADPAKPHLRVEFCTG